MACMAEMTALFPVKGPTFEFARRFVDESVGYACAWMLWSVYRVYNLSMSSLNLTRDISLGSHMSSWLPLSLQQLPRSFGFRFL